MPIAVLEEHEALRLTAQRWLQTHCPPSVPRTAAESTTAELPGWMSVMRAACTAIETASISAAFS